MEWVFNDVTQPASSLGGTPSLFADDLAVFQKFAKTDNNEHSHRHKHLCRTRVHKWDRINRVAFDPSKEHVVVIHPTLGEGDPFKLLGLLVDYKLIMDAGIEKILSQARPKIRAILRTKHHYNVAELITQFKTHIWGIMEIYNGGIFHAPNHLIDRFDSS